MHVWYTLILPARCDQLDLNLTNLKATARVFLHLVRFEVDPSPPLDNI